jgi:multidrug efflux pump subunit AcrA (membrane-fusion protein)
MSSVTPTVAPEVPMLISERRAGMRRFGLGVLVVLMLFGAWQVLTRFVAYTDDAYVRSDLIALAPQVSGRIVTVAVTDNQVVHRGDLLVEIDPEPFQLAVNASQAKLQQAGAVAQAGRASRAAAHDQLDSATAQSTDAQDLERRMAALGPSGAFSRDEEDEALATSRSSQARVAAERATIDRAQSLLGAQQAAIGQAQAELASAEWRLAKTKIIAPVDGTISNLNVQVGDTADADQPLIGIIWARTPGRWFSRDRATHVLTARRPGRVARIDPPWTPRPIGNRCRAGGGSGDCLGARVALARCVLGGNFGFRLHAGESTRIAAKRVAPHTGNRVGCGGCINMFFSDCV